MKSMIETMVTTIVMVILLFVFSSIAASQMYIMGARRVHTSVINQLQSSYYQVSVDDLRDRVKAINSNWDLEVEEVSSVSNRKDYLVRLTYTVPVIFFSGGSNTGIIEGYAR